jgi:hypothetical protein
MGILAFGGSGCRTSDDLSADDAQLASTGDESAYDFCKLSETPAPNPADAATWNAARVQQEIRSLRDAATIKGTPWSAYPALYLRMTAQRDVERCGGRLQPANRTSRYLNDRLADVMTRFYVLETAKCAAGQPPAHGGAGFCAMMQRVRAERHDALTAAMAMTSIYISSHIASSLRAVAADEPFWRSLGIADTVQQDPARAMRARIALLAAYRPDFDRFNLFLADQLPTVVDALEEERLLRNGALGLAVSLAKQISFRAVFFKRIRDRAFETAVEDAAELGGRAHPMLVPVGDGLRVDATRYDFAQGPTARERALEDFALDAVAGPSQRVIYRHLLGGKSWEELRREGLIIDASPP